MKNKKFGTGVLLVHSDSLGIHEKTCVSRDSSVLIDPDRPFHYAGIGKTATSVVILMLYEKGELGLDDPISNYLDRRVHA